MNIIFFTNTAPEYRIPLFQELSKYEGISFVFTRLSLAEKIYGNKIDNKKMEKIRTRTLKQGIAGFHQIRKWISLKEIEGVVIPPMDSFVESIYAYWIFILALMNNKKIFFYWEKWEAPLEKQPKKKRIKNYIQKSVAKPIFTRADYCFGMGTKACEYFINNGVKKEKCGITYNSSLSPVCAKTDWRTEYKIPDDKIVVMYFGRVIEKKGLRYLIESFSLLNDKTKEKTWLLVCGEGSERIDLYNYACSLGIKNMSWTGFVHPDYRYDYFSQCDIFVLPTFFYQGSVEGWGLTVNEAIQCKKRVISTTAVGSSYDLINEKNGVVVEPESASELARAIETLVSDEYEHSAYMEDDRLMKLYNYQHSAAEFVRIMNMKITNGEEEQP